MPFNEASPSLDDQYLADDVLRSYLRRTLPAAMLAECEAHLTEVGNLAATELYQLQLNDRIHEPYLTQWDARGNRIDQIEVSPLCQVAQKLAATHGIIAHAYAQRYGAFDRIYQFALVYLFHPSTDVYTCPLAMTDGAARTLLKSGN